jgi:hypothetical protein
VLIIIDRWYTIFTELSLFSRLFAAELDINPVNTKKKAETSTAHNFHKEPTIYIIKEIWCYSFKEEEPGMTDPQKTMNGVQSSALDVYVLSQLLLLSMMIEFIDFVSQAYLKLFTLEMNENTRNTVSAEFYTRGH